MRKNQSDIRLVFERVEPYIMGEVINKNVLVFEIFRWNRRGSYIREDNLQRSEGNKCGLRKR